ncbi:hypothetical protein C8R45DRAFT_936595 [Mycena sanguinolenta]|nr:hypothetical protein C8R45DRAFT_936595 [Mycena sanguinolenta]
MGSQRSEETGFSPHRTFLWSNCIPRTFSWWISNWGANHAGIRGWSMAAATEFVKRDECVAVDESIYKRPIRMCTSRSRERIVLSHRNGPRRAGRQGCQPIKGWHEAPGSNHQITPTTRQGKNSEAGDSKFKRHHLTGIGNSAELTFATTSTKSKRSECNGFDNNIWDHLRQTGDFFLLKVPWDRSHKLLVGLTDAVAFSSLRGNSVANCNSDVSGPSVARRRVNPPHHSRISICPELTIPGLCQITQLAYPRRCMPSGRMPGFLVAVVLAQAGLIQANIGYLLEPMQSINLTQDHYQRATACVLRGQKLSPGVTTSQAPNLAPLDVARHKPASSVISEVSEKYFEFGPRTDAERCNIEHLVCALKTNGPTKRFLFIRCSPSNDLPLHIQHMDQRSCDILGQHIWSQLQPQWRTALLSAIAEEHKQEADYLAAQGNQTGGTDYIIGVLRKYSTYLKLTPYRESSEYGTDEGSPTGASDWRERLNFLSLLVTAGN